MVRIAVGLALEAEMERDDVDSSLLNRLLDLYSNPNSDAVKTVHDELLESDSFEDREVGLWLEPALIRRRPDFDWREVVMDMQETELDLFDLAYLIETSEHRNEFRALGLLDWMNSIGSCVSNIRGGNWVLAKIDLNRAMHESLGESVEDVRKNEDFRGAVDEHRKATRSYLERILMFPCGSNVPEDRLDTILGVQELVIELKRKYHFESTNGIPSDVFPYAIEKLGVAEDYLFDSKTSLEQAGYEVGLASEHLKGKVENIRNLEARALVVKLQERIEFLFSQLPARPWPVEGFGQLGVESRFRKRSRGRSRIIR